MRRLLYLLFIRDPVQDALDQLLKGQQNIMATIKDIKDEFEAYRDDVKAKLAVLSEKITALQSVVNAGSDPAVAQAVFDEIKAAKDDLDGAVTPAPAPTS